MAYFTLVRPILEYGCAAWDLYLSRDIKTLKQIQNKALQFRLRGRVCFTDLRKKKTNIESFKDRRKTVRLNIYCKSIDNGVIKDTHCNGPLKTRTTR